MIDETTSVAVTKELIVYLRSISGGQVKNSFAAIRQTRDGTSDAITKAVTDLLASMGLEVSQGFCSDGASAMFGS